MAGAESRRVSISLSQRTKDSLDSIKHQGQSYGGLIEELVRLRKDCRKDPPTSQNPWVKI